MSCPIESPPQKKRKTSGTNMSRAWCYTLNNYTDGDIIKLESLEALRHVCSREVGESGTPHLQGYIRFAKPCRFSWWKNQFPSLHVEQRRGTEIEAVQYCLKDQDTVINIGQDSTRGEEKRTPRENTALDVMAMIENGSTIRQVYQAHPVFYFYNRRTILSVASDIKLWTSHPEATPET